MLKFFFVGALVAAVAGGADLTPRIAVIQVFGAYKINPQKIARALDVKPGDLPPAREEAESRILAVPGIVASSVQAVCCDQNGIVLYAGVEEKGAPHFEYHVAPASDVTLPQRVMDGYQAVIENAEASIRGHNNDEDLTNGYSLMSDPEGRQKQQDLIPLVADNLAIIDKVLRESSDPEQRQAAAYVIQYAPRTPREAVIMTDALQYAVRDPDESVRKVAIQSLKNVIIGARLHPKQHLHIEPTWFVELLNSLDWADRVNAAQALVTLTDRRNPDTLALIRERGWDAVLDMAKWQDLRYALPAFLLAGRVAGDEDAQITAAWQGDRAAFLRQITHQKEVSK